MSEHTYSKSVRVNGIRIYNSYGEISRTWMQEGELPLSYSKNMTAEQARELARVLNEHADMLEAQGGAA